MARYGGIDLGGTKIQSVVVDEAHEVLGSSRLPTPTTGGPAEVALAMIESINEALESAGVGRSDLLAVGVGSPGVVDDDAGTVTSARNLPDWEGTYPLGEKLEAAFAAPVGLSNDVNVATMAEFELGAAVPLAARRLLGHRRRWRRRTRRPAVGGPRRRRRDRPRGRQERRSQVPVRPDRLHGGLRRARRDGGACAREQARAPARRPGRRCDRRRRRLGAEPARRRGGGDRRRARAAPRRAV